MVHPGFSDSRLEEMLDGGQMAARWREEEVRVLADDGLRSMLDQLNVELISYRQLADRETEVEIVTSSEGARANPLSSRPKRACERSGGISASFRVRRPTVGGLVCTPLGRDPSTSLVPRSARDDRRE